MLPDEYHELLAKLGRSEEHDARILAHELGHYKLRRIIIAGTYDDDVFVSVTPSDNYDGICRSGGRSAAFQKRIDATDIRKILEPSMPQDGEDRSAKADVFQSVFDATTQLMGGEAAEELLVGNANVALDDRRQAKELAALICKTPQAIDAFIVFCLQHARDLLAPHRALLVLLVETLRAQRDMTGAELDRASELAADQIAREEWNMRVANADRFGELTANR